MGVKFNSKKPNKSDLKIGDVIKTEGTHGVEYFLVTLLEVVKEGNFENNAQDIGCVRYNPERNYDREINEQHVSRQMGSNRVLEKMGNINDEKTVNIE